MKKHYIFFAALFQLSMLGTMKSEAQNASQDPGKTGPSAMASDDTKAAAEQKFPVKSDALDAKGVEKSKLQVANPEARLFANPQFSTIVKYPDAYPNTELKVEQFRDHIKTTYTVNQNIFNDLPAGVANVAFVEKIQMPEG